MPVHITSEIGALQSVLVHTPGPELQAVTPGNRDDYLYDDIIELEIAQREHRRSSRCWSASRGCTQVGDLLAEVLEQPEAREFFIPKTMDVVPSDALGRR